MVWPFGCLPGSLRRLQMRVPLFAVLGLAVAGAQAALLGAQLIRRAGGRGRRPLALLLYFLHVQDRQFG